MLSVRHARFWLIVGWLMVIAATVVCLVPGKELPKTGIGDKWEHFICYGVLMTYFAGLYPRSRYWLIALLLVLMGIAIEFAQGAMHLGRYADIRDVAANSTGVAIGLVLSLLGLGRWALWIESLTSTREPARSE